MDNVHDSGNLAPRYKTKASNHPLTSNTTNKLDSTILPIMDTIDDLYVELGIDDPSFHSTCIGYGERKPDCGNPVARASRDAATAVLQRIWRNIDREEFNHGRMESELNEVAEYLHCKRYHQYQAGPKAEEWLEVVLDYRSERDERNTRVSQNSRSRGSRSGSPHRRSTCYHSSSREAGHASAAACMDRVIERQAHMAAQLTAILEVLQNVRPTGRHDDDRSSRTPDRHTEGRLRRSSTPSPSPPALESRSSATSPRRSRSPSTDSNSSSSLVSPPTTHTESTPLISTTSSRTAFPSPSSRRRSSSTSPASSPDSPTSTSECGICLSALPRQPRASQSPVDMHDLS